MDRHFQQIEEIIVCFQCDAPIYEFLNQPQDGSTLLSAEAVPIGRQPEPHPDEVPICLHCNKYPFVVHNTGVQAKTIDGRFIPERIENGTYII